MMRVLHVVKTADGAGWAADEAAELVRLGLELHVALPSLCGANVARWQRAGAVLHVAPTDVNLRAPWSMPAAARKLRDLVSSVRPDVIHSHFFSSTILLRVGLGSGSKIPRLFQVPGPLHMEHGLYRKIEISSATPSDRWIASSRCILNHYRAAGVTRERLYLSYYGAPMEGRSLAKGFLRQRYDIPDNRIVVGNANLMYPPKWYLGQRIGLKAQEDIIDALGLVLRQRADVMGVLIGGPLVGSHPYEKRLRTRAEKVGDGRILMTGRMPIEDLRRMWPDFDVAVHVPISENCGGVGEPLLAGVPTIAGRVGGLPEVVVDGLTGKLVGIRDPQELARAILHVIDGREHYRALAQTGGELIRTMFDIRRTSRELLEIYRHVLDGSRPQPAEFDFSACLRDLAGRSEQMTYR
jgi:glycosyltransferase involved in cell wall biosynthesis